MPTIQSRFFLPNSKLALDGNDYTQCYNPSVVDVGGKTYMFYRHAAGPSTTDTFIAYIELDRNCRILGTPKRLDIPLYNLNIHTIDDPRAFVWMGQLYISCVFCHNVEGRWSGALGLVKINPDSFKCEAPFFPQIGSNKNRVSFPGDGKNAIEKNWTPFTHGDDLFLIYAIDPLIVTMWDAKKRLFIEVWHGENHGKHVSGGTPLIPTAPDKYFSMWHDHVEISGQTMYRAGFWELDFKNMRASVDYKTPLEGNGDVYHNAKQDLSKFYFHKLNVVFPGGIVDRATNWYVSSGWNDCRCEIIDILK